jgi:hypothetical protein
MKKTKTWIRQRRQHWQDYYKINKGCEICGYDKHPRALSFDHLDPNTKHEMCKNGGIGTKTKAGGMWQLLHPDISLRVLIDEWRKCRILCMNCHMEQKYHYVDIKKSKENERL